MRKIILALILGIAFIFNYSIAFAAQPTNQLKEDKTAKIIINGTAFKNSNVLLLKNGTPMLSTDYFTALGIDSKNQVWDKSKKKLTLSKGNTKLTMELDSSNCMLNGKKFTTNIKPFTYKGKTYFPAELVATSFGNKFIPDPDTNTYFIKNNADFIKNKQLLDKVLTSMNGVSKVKISEHATFNLKGTGLQLNLVAPATVLSDRKAKAFNGNVSYKMITNGISSENSVQMCLYNNQMYMRVDNGEWSTQALSDESVALQFDFKGILGYNDLICSALNIVNGKNKDELILKGNIIMGNSIPSFMAGQGLDNNKISQKSIEITLNKNTNIVNKIVLKQSGTTVIEQENYNFSVDYVISYSDFNGKFEVVIPDELKE
ncbi:MAG: copper amine oxidase N-terminal domain-containing protein [Clostridia bacterium]|nr:copper amine oxidase N-terminal domain-containing protein [Clostridia bacterium]